MKKTYAIMLPESGRPEVVEFKKAEEGLEFYYKTLECETIDIVHSILEGYDLVVDDEGLLKEEATMNLAASILYGYLDHGQPIVGKALLCKREYTDEGVDTVGYPLEEAHEILELFGVDVTAED